MLQVSLTPEMERHLAQVSARVGQAPGEIAGLALVAYLEDLEDYAAAVEVWKEHDPAKTLTSDEMLRALDVED